MASDILGPPKVRRRLAELSRRELNFDPASLRTARPEDGWRLTDVCEPLASEPPGAPIEGGSWQIARRLMRGYEFADPSIVRAYYDPASPLEGRNMLLKLQALGIAHLYVGVRVGEVYEGTEEERGRRARVWGWNYRTLQGHVEMGQMDWQVWKWLDSGEVEFHVHAVSRTAHISNPIVGLGFHLVRDRERRAFLDSTKQRMRTFVGMALREEEGLAPIHEAAEDLMARRATGTEDAHAELRRNLGRPDGS